jgi:hypothetical protein
MAQQNSQVFRPGNTAQKRSTLEGQPRSVRF